MSPRTTLATTVSPAVRSWVEQAARDEHLTISQWLRDRIARERHKRIAAARRRLRGTINA